MASEVPGDLAGRYLLQPQRGRIGVQVPDGGGAGDGEAVRQPVAQVRAVQVGLGLPGDEGGGLGAQVRGDREPQRRPLVGVDDLDEEGERTDLSGAGPGGPGDQVASRGGDRGPVVREDLADEVRTVACRTPRSAAAKAASSSSVTSAGPRSTLRGAGSAGDSGCIDHAAGEGVKSSRRPATSGPDSCGSAAGRPVRSRSSAPIGPEISWPCPAAHGASPATSR